MSNAFDEVRAAVQQAKFQLDAADSVANNMANLLVGRLHHVNPYTLANLKRELRRFNINRKAWDRK